MFVVALGIGAVTGAALGAGATGAGIATGTIAAATALEAALMVSGGAILGATVGTGAEAALSKGGVSEEGDRTPVAVTADEPAARLVAAEAINALAPTAAIATAEIEETNRRLQGENMQLRFRTELQASRIVNLETQNRQLHTANQDQADTIITLRQEKQQLKERVERLEIENQDLKAEIKAQRAVINQQRVDHEVLAASHVDLSKVLTSALLRLEALERGKTIECTFTGKLEAEAKDVPHRK